MANQPSKYSKFLIGAASAALVASAVAPVASAADFKDTKGNTHEEAINALSDAGVISGYPDGSFLPNKTLTRSDVVKMMGKLLVSLGKEVPTDYKTNPRFTDQTSKTNDELLKYSALVKDNGVFNGLENGSLDAAGDITRENMALVLVRAYDAINKTDLVAHVKEQEFKKDVTDLATAKAEARPYIDVLDFYDITNPVNPTFNPKDTTTRGQFASFLFKTTAVEAPGEKVTTATKVESVTATNLKEVEVKFNGTVDEDSATDKANYTLKSGKSIKSIAISADKNAVTLTLEGTLTNNKADALTVSSVEAGEITINEKNVEFKVEDNKLPEVSAIKSLGTKSVKVVFSEPVTDLKQSNFTLDGKAFFGKIDMGAGNKSAILTPFSSSALEVGEHKLTVSGVKDFADFTSLNSTHDFTVIEDKDAPTVTEATATLESVTLTFSEDVDASTVDKENVYWKSGDSKKKALSVEALEDNKYKFIFLTSDTDNSLPTGAVDIHVEGVKDYSGNVIAKDTKVSVKPEIDQTRPEVRKVTASSDTEFKVTFSKTIDADSAAIEGNYIVKDKDGKVITVKSAARDSKDPKSVNVELYSKLSVGENTLSVKNVKDATKLKNTMVDYSGKIVKADKELPEFESVVKAATQSDKTNRVVLKFNKKMDVETLADYSNYLVQIDGSLQTLTSNVAELSITQDGTVVTLTFAETINGKDVVFASGTATSASGNVNINELQVLGLKDTSGNILSEFAAANGTNAVLVKNGSTSFDFGRVDKDEAVKYVAELVDRKTVKVKFSTVINSSAKDAITSLNSNEIDSINVDGSSVVTVKFKKDLKTDGSDLNLSVNFAKLVDIAGNEGSGVKSISTAIGTDNLLDSVAPVIVGDPVVDASAETITLTFSEALVDNGGVDALRNSDFSVVRVSDNTKLAIKDGYTVALANDAEGKQTKVVITLEDTTDRKADSPYKVSVDGAKYITDASDKENAVSNFSVTTKTKVTAGATLSIAAAQQAVTDAQAAKTTADNAVTAAQTAKTTADNAVTAAQTAKTTADNALLVDPTDVALQAAAALAATNLTTAQATAATKATDLTAAQATAATAATNLTAAQAALAALLG